MSNDLNLVRRMDAMDFTNAGFMISFLCDEHLGMFIQSLGVICV